MGGNSQLGSPLQVQLNTDGTLRSYPPAKKASLSKLKAGARNYHSEILLQNILGTATGGEAIPARLIAKHFAFFIV